MCIRREKREKVGEASLSPPPPFLSLVHILPICFDSAQILHIYHPQIHAIHTQLVIDNAGYIYYAEARILGHQNNAKQFTMMQQICANGPLHFPEECVILAEYIYRNRCPSTALFTTQQINRKPEHPCNLPVGVVVYRSGR
jgi:hypothetical protein